MPYKFSLKRRVFFTLLPVVILACAIEIILRFSGFFFYPGDLKYYINEDYRVFVPQARGSRFITNPRKNGIFIEQSFSASKASNAFRIFILGGSSVNWLGEFTDLKSRLSARFPGRRIEIINAGGLSYGSNRLLLVFQEILSYTPDLIIVYSGNNEFEEEFLKVIGNRVKLNSLNELFLHSRVYQLLSFVVYNAKKAVIFNLKNYRIHPPFPSQTILSWGISFDNQQNQEIYKNYYLNIEWMIKMAELKGVKIMLSTVVYNQIGIPPFYSPTYGGDYSVFKKNIDEETIDRIQPNERDPFLAYAKGEKLYLEGDFITSKQFLERAFVLDAQPHRANVYINEMIRKLFLIYKVPLIDIEKKVLQDSEGGVASLALFSDHCHFNKMGQDILVNEFFKSIEDYLKFIKW